MQTIVGVLRGGPSGEHEVSLKTGATILASLPEEHFIAHDIYIDKKGIWHDRGRPSTPERILRQVDVVLIALHGTYGEDGNVQRLLDRFGVRYAGTQSFGSHMAMHKVMSKMKAREEELLTPDFRYIEKVENIEEKVSDAVRSFHQPVVVKPVNWGSSIGVSIVAGYAPILTAVKVLFQEGAFGVLVEEYIRGTEVTAGVIEQFRGESLYSLPPVEIFPGNNNFYNFDAKYSGRTRHVCPGNFSRVITEEISHRAKTMHRSLGLRHYSNSDFIVSPKGIYYLETNTLPGFTSESNIPIALESVGVRFPEFLTHLVRIALS